MSLNTIEISDNILARLRRQEGLRSPNDLFDISTPADYEREQLASIQKIGSWPANINLQLEPSSIPDHAELLLRLYSLLDQITASFKNECQLLLLETPQISPVIAEFINQKNFDTPSFLVADYTNSRQLLDSIDKPDLNIDPEALLVVFNLPKPIANWWYKGGEQEWGNVATPIGEDIVPWGLLYRRLMLPVWDNLDLSSNLYKLYIQRLNDIADHQKDKYYYIWQVFKY